MKKLLAMAIILGVAACNGGDEGELEELDTDVELQQPAPPAGMPGDTMSMDTMMMEDTMMDTMGTGTTR